MKSVLNIYMKQWDKEVKIEKRQISRTRAAFFRLAIYGILIAECSFLTSCWAVPCSWKPEMCHHCTWLRWNCLFAVWGAQGRILSRMEVLGQQQRVGLVRTTGSCCKGGACPGSFWLSRWGWVLLHMGFIPHCIWCSLEVPLDWAKGRKITFPVNHSPVWNPKSCSMCSVPGLARERDKIQTVASTVL